MTPLEQIKERLEKKRKWQPEGDTLLAIDDWTASVIRQSGYNQCLDEMIETLPSIIQEVVEETIDKAVNEAYKERYDCARPDEHQREENALVDKIIARITSLKETNK